MTTPAASSSPKLDERAMLHRDTGAAALGLFRIVVFGLWAIHLLRTPLTRSADTPFEFFSPPGFFAYIPEGAWAVIFQPGPLLLIQSLALVLVLCAAAGLRPFSLFGPLAFVAVVFFDGVMKGWGGFINHGQIAPLVAALFLALSPAGDRLALFSRRAPSQPPPEREPLYRFPLVATSFVMAFAYALIGAHRVAMGGIEIFTGDALPTYLALRTFEYARAQFEVSALLLQSGFAVIVLKLGFFVVTIFEILSPLALVFRRFRLVWLIVIVPFHVTTLFTMNIFFWENLILIALVFTALPARFEAWLDARSKPRPGPPASPPGS